MRKIFVLVITIFAAQVITSCVGQDSSILPKLTEAKGKLFIIGGGSRPASLKDAMIKESSLSTGGYAVVLPMSSSNQDTAAHYGMIQFAERGHKAVAYKLESGDEMSDSKLDSLRKATMIYIPGGVQDRFMKIIEENPRIKQAVTEAYIKGAMIAGTSAGAAVMSRIMITGDQKNHSEYTSTFYHLEKNNIITDEGLGLLEDVIIDQHFVKRARNNRLLTAVMEYPAYTGIGIDESTAIVIEGKKVTVVGHSQVLVYRNLSDTVFVKNGKMAAKNIRLDIYLPGDSFTIQ